MTMEAYDTRHFKGKELAEEESLVCEALVREIGKADTWSAVMDGWKALLHVRHTASAMHTEARAFREHGGAADVVSPLTVQEVVGGRKSKDVLKQTTE